MDTFFEQLITIKKTAKDISLIILIWFATFFTIFMLFTVLYSPFSLLLSFGIGFGAFWLSTKLNVEFEYIITNGTLDIDKITNKSSRKRIMSLELANVKELKKVTPDFIRKVDRKKTLVACNIDSDYIYYLSAERSGKSNANLIFAPDKKLQSAIEKFAPKYLTNNLFKD